MQPPTETRSPAPLRGDEADLYRRHHRDLRLAVARAVHASPELIEDACHSAWAKLLRNQPRRGTFLAWLRVVAIHEAYRLSATERRDLHLEDLPHSEGWDAVIAGGGNLDDVVEAREVLRLLAQLPKREQEDLALLVAGFSYREIAEMTGRRTYSQRQQAPDQGPRADPPCPIAPAGGHNRASGLFIDKMSLPAAFRHRPDDAADHRRVRSWPPTGLLTAGGTTRGMAALPARPGRTPA